MNKNQLKTLLRYAMIASIYVVLTFVSYPLSYGAVQFRIAEALVLICFYRKDYAIPLIIGCLLANIPSPMGIVDVFFGTIATALSVLCIAKSKNLLVASIFPAIFNGILVGLEIALLETGSSFPMTWFISASWVFLGEFVVVTIFGVVLWKLLSKKQSFMELIAANQNIDKKGD